MNTAERYYGMGQHPTATQVVGGAGAAAGSIVPAWLVAAGSVGGPVGAIIGAGIMGVTMAIEAIINSGCGQTCVVTSQWANQAEKLLQQNIQAYFAINPPRPKSLQQQATQNFQTIWNTLVQQCSQPGLGTAGKNCIADRADGGCKWKAGAPSYPGQPSPGSCWNWWNGYYYPIATDTQTYDDSVAAPVTNAISALTGGAINPDLLIGVALVGGALVLGALS